MLALVVALADEHPHLGGSDVDAHEVRFWLGHGSNPPSRFPDRRIAGRSVATLPRSPAASRAPPVVAPLQAPAPALRPGCTTMRRDERRSTAASAGVAPARARAAAASKSAHVVGHLAAPHEQREGQRPRCGAGSRRRRARRPATAQASTPQRAAGCSPAPAARRAGGPRPAALPAARRRGTGAVEAHHEETLPVRRSAPPAPDRRDGPARGVGPGERLAGCAAEPTGGARATFTRRRSGSSLADLDGVDPAARRRAAPHLGERQPHAGCVPERRQRPPHPGRRRRDAQHRRHREVGAAGSAARERRAHVA